MLVDVADAEWRVIVRALRAAELLDAPPAEQAVVVEEVGRLCPAEAAVVVTRHVTARSLVARFGSESTRKRFLAADDIVVADLASPVPARSNEGAYVLDVAVDAPTCLRASVGGEAVVVVAEGAAVPAWCRLDVDPDAALAEARLLAAWCATGAAARFLEAAHDFSRARVTFGSPLFRHQAVRLRLAELRAHLEGSRALNEAAVAGDAWSSAVALFKAGRLVRRVAEECLSLHGASGYLVSHPASGFPVEAHRLAHPDQGVLAELVRMGSPRGR